MKIGIIVHSMTGTTLKFGQLIANGLIKNGHTVDLIELKTDIPVDGGSVRGPKKFKITNIPDCKGYGAILIGGPVWAFSASPVIISCIEELNDISDKKILPFVTMGFPFYSMGGNQAIKLMSKKIISKGAQVLPGKIIPKLFHDYNKLMKIAVEEIQKCLSA